MKFSTANFAKISTAILITLVAVVLLIEWLMAMIYFDRVEVRKGVPLIINEKKVEIVEQYFGATVANRLVVKVDNDIVSEHALIDVLKIAVRDNDLLLIYKKEMSVGSQDTISVNIK